MQVVSGAWVNERPAVAATASHGKMWGRAYSMCNSGIFVAADSPYRRPEDLAGVGRFASVRVVADGRSWAYTYMRVLSNLYVVEGLH